MKKATTIIKSAIFFAVISTFCVPARAQKVSNVQQGSVWAPDSVKIDGKLTEWGNTLQAYNKSTLLWYTLANNDKNIYLVIKSTGQSNNNKILAGGISLTINTAGKKKDKDAFVITFPVPNNTGMRGMGRRRGGDQQDTPDSAAIIAQQRQTLADSKEISALGFKDITDTLISIYNEYSIKAVAKIDDKGNFVYELAVPLQLLGLSTADAKEIAYNVKVNGLQIAGFGGFGGGGGGRNGGGGGGRNGGGGDGGGGGGFGGGSAFGGKSNADNIQDITAPTDFWGKYTLATGKITANK